MGKKWFGVKMRDKATRELRFGKIISYRPGEFLTLHTKSVRGVIRCGYCNSIIQLSHPYVRFHTMRDEDTKLPNHEPRCMMCIGRGILPDGIEYINVFEKTANELRQEILTTVLWVLETRTDDTGWSGFQNIHTDWHPVVRSEEYLTAERAKAALVGLIPRYQGIGWQGNTTRVTEEFKIHNRVEYYRVREVLKES